MVERAISSELWFMLADGEISWLEVCLRKNGDESVIEEHRILIVVR